MNRITAVSKHLKKIFEEGELDEKVVVSKMEITSPHGAMPDIFQTSEAMFYNLDAIISVGYRINSKKATRFRICATTILKEYMTKGFVLDEKQIRRLERAVTGYFDYIEDLIERENVFTTAKSGGFVLSLKACSGKRGNASAIAVRLIIESWTRKAVK